MCQRERYRKIWQFRREVVTGRLMGEAIGNPQRVEFENLNGLFGVLLVNHLP